MKRTINYLCGILALVLAHSELTGQTLSGAPTIVSFSPSSGSVGTQVTLVGTNFDPTPANNTVFFGATLATVVSATESELVVTVPYGATYEPITVLSNQLVAQSLAPFYVTFENDVTLNETSFAAIQAFPSGANPTKMAIGDLDNDGLADLIGINEMDQTLSIYRNTSTGIGDINFAAKVDHALAGAPGDVLVDDLNGDGYLDVAVGYTDVASFSIFENTTGSPGGNITFDIRQDISITTDSYAMAATDINVDGKLDLVVTEHDADQLLIFENTSTLGSDISFLNNSSLITGDGPKDVAVADIDLDGLRDLIVSNEIDMTVSIFLKDGTSFGFAARQDQAAETTSAGNIAIRDIDLDGVLDIIVAIDGTKSPKVRLLMNQSTPGSLDFKSSAVLTELDWVELADLNGDGRMDLLHIDRNNGLLMRRNLKIPLTTPGFVSLDGPKALSYDGTSAFFVTGDLDNDGEPEIIITTVEGFIEVARNFASGNSFTSFSMGEQASLATIDMEDRTISIDVVDCTDLTNLIPNFDLTQGASAAVATVPQQSGVTANDFSSPVLYVVTAEDGSTKSWEVTVNVNHLPEQVEQHVSACVSYEFDGMELTTSGVYEGTFTNIHGCDSVVTLNLTIGAPISGNYTIGTTSGTEDYTTISAAIADLKTCPVGGDVTYLIGAGTYHETMDLSSINNGDFTITFSGAGAESTIVHPMDSIVADKSGVSLVNTSNVVLKNFTLEMDDISAKKVDFDFNETKGIHVSGSSNVTLENLVLSNANYSFSESYAEYIASSISLVGVEAVVIDSCIFSGAGIHIYLEDFQTVSINGNDFSKGQNHIYSFQEADTEANALTIDGNFFTGPFPTGRNAGAVYLTGHVPNHQSPSFSANYKIENNSIDAKVAGFGDAINGIRILNSRNPIIRNNVIEDGGWGIYISGCTNNLIESNQVYRASESALHLHSGGLSDVVNNIFTSTYRAGTVILSPNARVAHNTFHTDGTLSALRLQFLNGDSLKVLNNILSVENTSDVELNLLDIGASEIAVDHNLYSGNAAYAVVAFGLGGASGLTYNAASLSDWQAHQALYSQNSQSFDPVFAGAGDYHIADATSYRFGTAISDITTDIDGHDRTQSGGVDVGADQYLGERGNISGIPRLDDITFEVIQPAASPVIDLDLFKGDLGENMIYDMDGDGDIDFLSFVRKRDSRYQYVAYLNDGYQHYAPMDLTHDFGFSPSVQRPLIRVADLNMDGINDIVVGGEGIGSSVQDLGPTKVFFGDAAGQLHEQSQLVFPSSRFGDIRVEDFNGDTYPDLFIHGGVDGELHLNDGTGSFSLAPLTGFTDGFLLRLAVSVPYNGGVDMITEIWDGGRVNVIYRYENGVFTEVMRDFRTINDNRGMEFGDANGDGFPDVLITDVDNTLLYLNDQSGNYSLDTSNDFDNQTVISQRTLHFTDLNNDGAAEVVFSKEDKELAVFWNDGTGNYDPHQTYDISKTPWVSIGDLTGDGFPDIANIGVYLPTPVTTEQVTHLYINDQANGFDRAQLNVFPEFQHGDIQLLDANEDGHEDLLVSGTYYEGTQSITELYLNDGTGAFTQVSGQPFEGLAHSSIAMADFNGDAHQDVILSGLNQSDEVHTRLYLGDGAGSFAEDASNFFSGVMGESVAFDANGDEHPDLFVIGNDGTGALLADLYLNDGAGALTLYGAGLAGLDSTVSVAVGDIDADEDVDLLIQGTDGLDVNQMWLYTNDGFGNFTEITGHGLEALADGKVLLFDADGDEDLDVYLSGGGQFLIYTNDGSGSFTETQREEGPTRSTAAVGDIDLDGDLDLVEAGGYGTYYEPLTFVHFNDGSGHFTRERIGALHGIFDAAIALGDLDQDLDLEVVLSGAVWNDETSTSRIYRNTSCGTTATVSQQVTSCSPYDFYGTLLTTSGHYAHVITSADGCERTVNLDFTYEGDYIVLDETTCSSYLFDGANLTTSGQYVATFTNQVGCDSLVTLNLIVNEFPQAPSGLVGSNVTDNSFDLTWDAETIDDYEVQYKISGSAEWTSLQIEDASATSVSTTISGLEPATDYAVRVRGLCDGAGIFSGIELVSTAGISCEQVVITSATPSINTIDLNWNIVGSADSYEVQYKVSGAAGGWTTHNVSGTSTTISGLQASTSYVVRVRAICSGVLGTFSTIESVTTDAISCEQVVVTNVTPSTNAIDLTWNPVGSADSYEVQYKVSGAAGGWTTQSEAGASTTISGLETSTNYVVRVRAICGGVFGTFSAIESVTTDAISCEQVVITSAIPSTNAIDLAWNTVGSADSYEVQYKVNGAAGGWTTENVTTTSTTLSGLRTSTNYVVRVRAICSGVLGTFSVIESVTTDAISCEQVVITSATPTSNTIDLVWDAVGSADSYDVQHKVSGGSSWTTVNETGSSATIAGLLPTTNYVIRVRAICSGVSGTFSAMESVTTNALSCEQVVITNSTPSDNSIDLTWNTVVSADSYQVQYKVSGGGAWTTVNESGTSTTITGLSPSTSYVVRVRAICSGVAGTFSAISSVATSAVNCEQVVISSAVPSDNSIDLTWNAVSSAGDYQILYKVSGSPTWSLQTVTTAFATIAGLQPLTTYVIRVRSRCSGIVGTFSALEVVTTTAIGARVGGDEESMVADTQEENVMEEIPLSVQVYPNPVTGNTFNVAIDQNVENARFRIIAMDGRVMDVKYEKVGLMLYRISTDRLAEGIHILEFEVDGRIERKKLYVK